MTCSFPNSNKRTWVVAGALAGALLLSACGGNAGQAASSAPAASASSAAAVSSSAAPSAAAPASSAAASASSSAASSASSSGSASSPSASGVDYAKTQIAKYTAVPQFTAPGPAFDAKKLAGKTIFNIPQNTSIPFLAATDTAMGAIAKRAGINFVEYPTQGQPNQWSQGVEQAVSQKVAGLSINALDPRLVAPQLQDAKTANIPVTSAQFFDFTQTSQVPPTVTADRADDFSQAAKLEADWVIADTGGKADVVIVENKEQLSTLAMDSALSQEFATYCPSCKLTVINVPGTDWATRIQPSVQSALVQDPAINYIIPIYDPMTQFVVPAITAAGMLDKVHIATFNGTPFALKMMQDGDSVRMDIGENLDWLASANMDQIMRTMLGLPPLENEHTALRVFTKQNVGDTGSPPAYNLGFGNAYVAGYNQLWGLS